MIVYLVVFPAALIYIVHIVRDGPAPDTTPVDDGPIGSGHPVLPIEALPSREGGQP
jgi:hypothetical protein